MKKIVLLNVIAAMFLASCGKDEENGQPITPENVSITLASKDSLYPIGETVKFTADVKPAGASYTYTWYVNNKPIGSTASIDYKIENGGEQHVKLQVTGGTNSFDKEMTIYAYKKATEKSSKWISEILDYRPAPGQFINKNPGNMESAQGIAGKRGMVSLGAFGGYITFKFDHSVLNKEGVDFVVHGNAFDGSSEAGIVMVAYDKNGNQKPDDDEWYELKGELYNDATTIKGYELTYTKPSQTESAEDVTWTDNQGEYGAVHSAPIIAFHRQCYYPLFLTDNPSKLIFKGTKLKNLAHNTAAEGEGQYWKCESAGWGYADDFSADYMEKINDDADTQRSNKFDIANAVDASGKAVKLPAVDFIKVYNCLNQEAGWLGETSTEVCGAISLSVEKIEIKK